jgi:hypothetical protein
MTRLAIILVLLISLTSCGGSAGIALDASTPEGVILMVEDAYNRGDLEAAVALKDFRAEAFYMLKNTMGDNLDELELLGMDNDLVTKTAEVLELSYREEMKTNGLPDFSQLESSFPSKKDLGDGYWEVTEKCKFPDGGYSEQKILVYYNGLEYRMCNPITE